VVFVRKRQREREREREALHGKGLHVSDDCTRHVFNWFALHKRKETRDEKRLVGPLVGPLSKNYLTSWTSTRLSHHPLKI
jgi:hypothetical protein